MRRILGLAMAMAMVASISYASSKVDIPSSARLSDGTAWLFTETNPGKVRSAQLPTALDANGNLKVHEQGTANVKLDTTIDTNLGKVKVTDGTDVLVIGANGSVDVNILGTLTGIANDVGIKDNGNVISVDSAQLPSALDGNGNLKVGIQGTVPVNIVGSAQGTAVSGYYTLSIAAGATTEIGSYTVTAAKTLHVNAFGATMKGDGLVLVKVAGANKKALGTEAGNSQVDVYLGDNYTIPAATVLSVTATNNEAVAVTAYFSWCGLEVTN